MMRARQPSIAPLAAITLWLVSDARNDARLERALRRLPRGQGFIFRHTHLDEAARGERLAVLARLARARGHALVVAAPARQAARMRGDGAYGPPGKLGRGRAMTRLVTAHCLREIARARRARADAILLSPVFPTRSHPGAATLGGLRFRLMARWAEWGAGGVPVIALGGMDHARARALRWPRWAAIDGLSGKGRSGKGRREKGPRGDS